MERFYCHKKDTTTVTCPDQINDETQSDKVDYLQYRTVSGKLDHKTEDLSEDFDFVDEDVPGLSSLFS